jgi:GNAT superfamily N-acetyltransferase
MPIASFNRAHHRAVIALRDVSFASFNLSRFHWQPCQQTESLDRPCPRYVYDDGEVKGYGAAYRLDETHFRLNLLVHPFHTRRGIGSQLLGRVEEDVARAGGRQLQARVLESPSGSVTFPSRRGFLSIHTMRGMSLDARDFEFEKWVGLGKTLFGRGFRVTSLAAALRSDEDATQKLARLYRSAREGWPTPDPTWSAAASDDSLRTPIMDVAHPERFSIMANETEYVAFTSAKNLATGTGVHPAYRNLGIATYLKAYDINECIQDGDDYFESASASEAMQRVNEKLGYRYNGLSEVRFVKVLALF